MPVITTSRGLMPLLLRVGAFLRTFHSLLKISPFTVAQLKDALLKDASVEMPRLLHAVHHALLYHILYGAQETVETDNEDIALQCDRRVGAALRRRRRAQGKARRYKGGRCGNCLPRERSI